MGIDPKISRATRDLFEVAVKGELEKIPSLADSLSEEDRAQCLQLSVLTTGHLAIAIVKNRWPTDDGLRRIAQNLANAKLRVTLDEDDVYTFLARVVFGFEHIERVFPDLGKAFMLTVLVSANLLLVCCPEDTTMWRYMDQIEDAVEATSELPAHAIPSVVYRSRVPSED